MSDPTFEAMKNNLQALKRIDNHFNSHQTIELQVLSGGTMRLNFVEYPLDNSNFIDSRAISFLSDCFTSIFDIDMDTAELLHGEVRKRIKTLSKSIVNHALDIVGGEDD